MAEEIKKDNEVSAADTQEQHTSDVAGSNVQAESDQQLKKLNRQRILGCLKAVKPLFLCTVLVPTICAAIYFSVWASDQFQSEASFIVRSSNNQATLSGLGALLQTAGIARSQDDTYTVQQYIQSRAALSILEKQFPIRQFYENKGDVFSRFNGFGLSNYDEGFYQYYDQKVDVQIDAVSGISTLYVRSFSAQDSQKINQALLKASESFINRLNDRARKDTVAFAEQHVQTAERFVKEASDKLMEYRTKNGVFDLKEQTAVQMSLVSKLQDELIMIQTQLDQIRAVTPENPQIAGLKARERSLRKEIERQMFSIAGRDNNSIASKAAEYQRLYIENDLAEKQLAAALASLEAAKAEAERKQLYLEVVSPSSLPDMPQGPRRFYNIIATFVIGMMIYGILRLLIASIREHKN